MLSISGGKPVLFRNKPEKEYITFTNIAGVGEEHAKWSPVATAWYRLMPEVVLLRPVTGDEAAELASTRRPGFRILYAVVFIWCVAVE